MAQERFAKTAVHDWRRLHPQIVLAAASRLTARVVGEFDEIPEQPIGGWPKRALDIVVASTALVAAAPAMAAVFLLIKTTGRGPALFSQSRIGYGGRLFRCWKFRTMVVDADERLEAHLADNPDAAREWELTRKLENDPRITRLGKFLRRSSLDELPQLINVLAGDMSCVGPRPVVPRELAKYGPATPDYLRARPGLTGLWQVSGRSALSYDHRVALDVDYVRRRSFWLDVTILARTLPAVMDMSAAR